MRLVIQDFQEDSHEGPSLKGGGSCESHAIPGTTVKAHVRIAGVS